MTREELIELAALDAYGLLDRYETQLYTRSFHHAPAAVQDEIRQLQADVAADDSGLADEMPPVHLRKRVLAAVAEAIEQEDSRLVIARIGRRRAGKQADPAQGRGVLAMLFGGSGQFWRAAVFALAGALIAMAYSWNETRRSSNELVDAIGGRMTIEQIAIIEGDLGIKSFGSIILDPTTDFVALRQSSSKANGLLVVDENDNGYLLFDGLAALPAGEEYEVSVTDENGRTHALRSFTGRNGLAAVAFSVANIAVTDTSVWTVSTAAGPVLTS